MSEGDHLHRAIELVRGCGGDPHTIDRAVTLIQHEVYMREEDARTKVRVLLYEFQAMFNEIEDWAKFKDYVDRVKGYRLKFRQLGARDFASCIGALPQKHDCANREFVQITYMNGVIARMTDIAYQQYGVALQLPVF